MDEEFIWPGGGCVVLLDNEINVGDGRANEKGEDECWEAESDIKNTYLLASSMMKTHRQRSTVVPIR